ncbi:MAG: YheU family protein [Magnetococcales bacterium]|nr:YheU family protein [Magnetococcales bacterium]
MDIPPDRLSPEVLQGIIEEFINREGTDYGMSEVSLETKIAQILVQIDRGEVVIRYDERTQSCNLLPQCK